MLSLEIDSTVNLVDSDSDDEDDSFSLSKHDIEETSQSIVADFSLAAGRLQVLNSATLDEQFVWC